MRRIAKVRKPGVEVENTHGTESGLPGRGRCTSGGLEPATDLLARPDTGHLAIFEVTMVSLVMMEIKCRCLRGDGGSTYETCRLGRVGRLV